jgi:hypothetical protein
MQAVLGVDLLGESTLSDHLGRCILDNVSVNDWQILAQRLGAVI